MTKLIFATLFLIIFLGCDENNKNKKILDIECAAVLRVPITIYTTENTSKLCIRSLKSDIELLKSTNHPCGPSKTKELKQSFFNSKNGGDLKDLKQHIKIVCKDEAEFQGYPIIDNPLDISVTTSKVGFNEFTFTYNDNNIVYSGQIITFVDDLLSCPAYGAACHLQPLAEASHD